MAILFLSNCANRTLDPKPLAQLETLYDYQILDSQNKQPISVSELAAALDKTQVIFMGEFHSHQASHKLQLDFLQALYRLNPKLVVTMEQFTRDVQPILSGYLAGEFGEETLMEEGKAWPAYKGSYRAIVEFAREHDLPVIAANAPAMFVRCVGQKGASVLDEIPEEKKSWSAQKLDLDNKKYKQKFMSFINESGRSHGQTKEEAEKRQNRTYAAQLLRDTTMAESIAAALIKYPGRQIVHLNGAFHSDNHLGTVAVLESMSPELAVKVVSPVDASDPLHPIATEKEYSQGDYIYLLKTLPERYIDEEKLNTSIRKLIKERMGKKCEL